MIFPNPPRAAARETFTGSVWNAPAPLRLWHLASLDAPTVAVTWAWAFAQAARVVLPLWNLFLLGLVVWAIYIGDRLLDVLPQRNNPPRHCLQERHYFHWRYRWILAPLGVISASTALWLVGSRLSGLAIRKDSLVAVAALTYFSGVHGRSGVRNRILRSAGRIVSREFVVGVIFSAGCILPLLSVKAAHRISGITAVALLLAGLFFAMLAWLNVRAIGSWETFAPAPRRVRLPALVLGIIGAVLASGFAPVLPRMAVLFGAATAGALLLGLLDCSRVRFTPMALRISADLVLLIPLIFAGSRLAG